MKSIKKIQAEIESLNRQKEQMTSNLSKGLITEQIKTLEWVLGEN